MDELGRIDWDTWCADGSNIRAARPAAGAKKGAQKQPSGVRMSPAIWKNWFWPVIAAAGLSGCSASILGSALAGPAFAAREFPADAKHAFPMWRPDGAALYYMSDESGAENIWTTPLSAGRSRCVNSGVSRNPSKPGKPASTSMAGNGGKTGYAEEKQAELAEMTGWHHSIHLDGVNNANGERVWS